MNFLIILSVVLNIVLSAFIIYLLFFKKEKVEDEEEFDRNEFLEKLKNKRDTYSNIFTMDLPRELEYLSTKDIREISRKIFWVYEKLDYKNSGKDYYEDSWHSWQFSVFLVLYKKELDFFIADEEKIFKDEILFLNEKSLKELVNKILLKYKKMVNVKAGKDVLSQHKIWSGQEISVIMYFLTKYKEFDK